MAGLAKQIRSERRACSRRKHGIGLEWQATRGLHRKWQWLYSTPCTIWRQFIYHAFQGKILLPGWVKLWQPGTHELVLSALHGETLLHGVLCSGRS